MAANGYDGPLRLSGKIAQITQSPIYLKCQFTKKADNSQYEKYWLEQHMDSPAIQKIIGATFKVGDEITVTIDTHHSFGGGIQLLKDFAPKAQGGNGFFKSSYNPEAEKRKQESIERQNARGIAKDILAICFEQYPIAAKPENLENALILFPQLMEQVKKGERILLGGE